MKRQETIGEFIGNTSSDSKLLDKQQLNVQMIYINLFDGQGTKIKVNKQRERKNTAAKMTGEVQEAKSTLKCVHVSPCVSECVYALCLADQHFFLLKKTA